MDSESILKRTEELAVPILEELLLELVASEFAGSQGRRVLRLYIDRSDDRCEADRSGEGGGGVDLGEIVQVSRELGAVLDAEDFIRFPYTLEVSSPGFNRPLRRRDHFEKHLGERVRIRTRRSVDGRRNFLGPLEKVEPRVVTVRVDGRPYRIGLEEIEKANLEFDYSKLSTAKQTG